MDSEVTAAIIVDEVSELEGTSEDGSEAVQKKPKKVPKRVHKSEREKMKREHLNDLFLALANALGQADLNNGKASILAETNRLVNEMHDQIHILRKENATLLSESQYVLMEKEELRDETSVLESEVESLRIEQKNRILHFKPDLNVSPLGHTPYANPLYVIPVCPDFSATQIPTSTVSKPQARYPTLSDSWPSQLLTKQPEN